MKLTRPVLTTAGAAANPITLSATPTRFEVDVTGSGDMGARMRNQVTFHIKVRTASGGADVITMALKELFTHRTSGAEDIGWTDYMEEHSTAAGELAPWSRNVDTVNSDGSSAFSVSFATSASKAAIMLSCAQAVVIDVWATVAKVS